VSENQGRPIVTTARERVNARRARRRMLIRRPPDHNSGFGSHLLGILNLLTLVALLVGVSALVLSQANAQRLLPGVHVQGQALGGLTVSNARAVLQQRYQPVMMAPVTFALDGRSWRPTAVEIGMRLEIDDAVEEAYRTGRDVGLVEELRRFTTARDETVDVPIRITLDERRLQAYLLDIAGSVEIAPQSASLVVSQGQVLVTPARIGRQILIDDTARDVLAALPRLEPYTATVRVRPLAPVMTDAAVADAQKRLTVLLQGAVELRANDQTWQWTPEEIGELVRLQQVATADGSLRLDATLDRAQLAARVESMAQQVAKPPIEPRLRFSRAQLEIVEPGRTGVSLDTEMAVAEIETALWQGRRTITLPLRDVEPLVSEAMLERLGIVELVAQGKSDFTGSAPYRVTNIVAGAERMNGVLIPPGGEFSFNQTVGAIDESNGFTRGYAIIDGRTQLEWGGGVCQVSRLRSATSTHSASAGTRYMNQSAWTLRSSPDRAAMICGSSTIPASGCCSRPRSIRPAPCLPWACMARAPTVRSSKFHRRLAS
jgi:vancomycin resistance protein YoaR